MILGDSLQWSRANDGAETLIKVCVQFEDGSFNGAAPMMARKLRVSLESRARRLRFNGAAPMMARKQIF